MNDKFTIRAATNDDVPAVALVLAEAFKNDASFLRKSDKVKENPIDILTQLFTSQLEQHYMPEGVVDVVTDGATGRVVACALWEPPEASKSLLTQTKLVAESARLFGADVVSNVVRQVRNAKYHPQFPHWYLYTIAALPETQGEGIGSALLSHGFERVGDTPIFLEASSARSAALYHSMGFVTLGYIPDNDDMESELAMWRPGPLPTEGN